LVRRPQFYAPHGLAWISLVHRGAGSGEAMVETRAYDEMHGASGEVREHYRAFADWLASTPRDRLAQKRAVGDAVREIHRRDAAALKEHSIEFNVSMIFGGQIGTEPPRLFCIYAAGNYIEATADTPYFQIGESKYGKPIIDRVVSRSTSLAQAAKCALISMDSTIRSNLSVGLPLDLVTVQRDALRIHSHVNIDEQHAYFRMVRTRWSESLRHAFHELPDPDWIRRS
jgi:putative proteasome-type protease